MDIVILVLLIAAIFGFYFRKEIKEKLAPSKDKNYTLDDRYNSEKRDREKEIDSLLAKIGKNGLDDLSPRERKRLDELSKK